MKIEVIHLEVAELDEEEQEEEMEEVEEDSTMEESSLTKKAHHSQSVIFVKEVCCEQKNNVWFLDGGCTNHMTGNKNIFLDMDTTINSQVKMGNGDLVNVKGKAQLVSKQKWEPSTLEMFFLYQPWRKIC
ncbi:hypothetical protein AAG906_025607 [Vitis piasezkii]